MKNKKFLLSFLLIVSTFLFINNVEALSMARVTNEKGTYARTGPSTNYSSKLTLKYNDVVTLTSTTKYTGTGCSSGWYRIILNGSYNYVCSSHVSTSTYTIRVNNSSGVNTRNGAGTNYSIYKRINNNALLTLNSTAVKSGKGCSNGWYNINLNGYTNKSICRNYTKSYNSNSNVIVTSTKGATIKSSTTTSASIATVRYNEALTLYSTTKYKGKYCSAGYYKVYYRGYARYVCSSYVLNTKYNATVTNKSGVSLRSGAGTNKTKLTTLKYNSYASLVSSTKYKGIGCSAGWYKIKLNGKYGYVCSTYLSTSSLSTYIIDVASVNIRSGAGTNYSKITTALKNENITLLSTAKYKGTGCSAGWYKISINGKTGYVCSSYTKLGKDTAPRTTTPSTSTGKVITKTSTKYSYYNTINKWTYRVNEDYAYIRTSPTGKVQDTVYIGTELDYLGTSRATSNCSSGWYKVKYFTNKTGYICKTYVDSYSSVTKTDSSYCTTLKNNGFPASYCPYLSYLHAKYPNWVFKAEKVGDSFLNAINQEAGKNYTQISKSSYISSNSIAESPNWRRASDAYIAFMLDPRSYLNEKNIFAFEQLSYNSTSDNKTIVRTVLDNTWLDTDTYAGYFVEAGKSKNVSPGVLAARVKQEGGSKKSYAGVSGTVTNYWNVTNSGYICSSSTYGAVNGSYFKVKSGYNLNVRSGAGTNKSKLKYPNGNAITATINDSVKLVSTTKYTGVGCSSGWYKVSIGKSLKGIYNFYNIGAYGDNPVLRGLAAAAGYVDNLDGTPWNSTYKAIVNGASFVANGYINRGQDTLYYQKFDVDSNTTYYDRYSHQYMTNILAPASESLSAYRSYKNLGILNKKLVFKIPVYNSMPTAMTSHPVVQ